MSAQEPATGLQHVDDDLLPVQVRREDVEDLSPTALGVLVKALADGVAVRLSDLRLVAADSEHNARLAVQRELDDTGWFAATYEARERLAGRPLGRDRS